MQVVQERVCVLKNDVENMAQLYVIRDIAQLGKTSVKPILRGL